MKKRAYYNDVDPKNCAWTRELIKRGLVMDGDVDERSITEVRPDDVRGYIRCHFFSGISGWDLALRWAGWPEDRPIWTGSCPCQPFSAAGKRKGIADERHLWPAWFRLIRECRPATIIGEQVASKAALDWLDGVFADLEGAGYACGAADLCAASVGAPHIRQRLYWMGVSNSAGSFEGRLAATPARYGSTAVATGGTHRLADAECSDTGMREQRIEGCAGIGRDRPAIDGGADRMANAERDGGREYQQERGSQGRTADGRDRAGAGGMADGPSGGLGTDGGAPRQPGHADERGAAGGMGNASAPGREGEPPELPRRSDQQQPAQSGAWSDYQLVWCRDETYRRIESGSFPLVAGLPRVLGPGFAGLDRMGIRAARANRVIRLKGYGNAIVVPLAVEFVRTILEFSSRKNS